VSKKQVGGASAADVGKIVGQTAANPFGFFLSTFVKRLGGERPFDLSPGQATFGPFIKRVIAETRPAPPTMPPPAIHML
jgi:hypothetical protein